jgi:hypothetical protein
VVCGGSVNEFSGCVFLWMLGFVMWIFIVFVFVCFNLRGCNVVLKSDIVKVVVVCLCRL